MIFLIGGSPRCGKTKLAKIISKRTNLTILSTDRLRKKKVKETPPEQKELLFPFEKLFKNDKLDKAFATYTAQDMVRADLQEARMLWPEIESFINKQVIEGRGCVIEGVHLLPKYLKNFISKNKKIKIIYLVKSNENKIIEGLKNNHDKKDWVLRHIKNEETFKRVAKMVKAYSSYFKTQSRKYGFTIINTENNFHKSLMTAYKETKKPN